MPMTRKIQHLFVYPLKSAGGAEVEQVKLTPTGFDLDRKWMLVDENGKFLSQREIPEMAFLRVQLKIEGCEVFSLQQVDGDEKLFLHPEHFSTNKVRATVWSDQCLVNHVSEQADAFFSSRLKRNVRLVFMSEDVKRLVDSKFNRGHDITSFSDGFPFLMIGSASLDELNRRLKENGYQEELGWDRFRPNIVVQTEVPFEEDHWKFFEANGIRFDVVKPCARCVITTTNQQTAARNREPLQTLAQFRAKENKVMFGQNCLASSSLDWIELGQSVNVGF